MAGTIQDLELHNYKTVLNIKESNYGTWFQKTSKNCRLIDLNKMLNASVIYLRLKK